MHKLSTPTLYQKNMVLIPFTIDPWARFGPVLQAYLTTTHHPRQKPWRTTHTNYKYHRPNANLMYERASQPPCSLGILTSADLQWVQSASPTQQTFFGNSYTAPTPSLHTLKLIGLSISKVNSSLLCNATHTFQLHPTAPTLFDLYSFLTLEDTYPVNIYTLHIINSGDVSKVFFSTSSTK